MVFRLAIKLGKLPGLNQRSLSDAIIRAFIVIYECENAPDEIITRLHILRINIYNKFAQKYKNCN